MADGTKFVLDERKIMSGTWGEVWLGEDKVGEAYGIQAKCNFQKEKINLCGNMGTGSKLMNYDGTGSLKMRKCNSRMGELIASSLNEGKDVRFTIISKLDDPDADGAEKVALYGVSFDDLTLTDWEAGRLIDIEAPFTFSSFKYLDWVVYGDKEEEN